MATSTGRHGRLMSSRRRNPPNAHRRCQRRYRLAVLLGANVSVPGSAAGIRDQKLLQGAPAEEAALLLAPVLRRASRRRRPAAPAEEEAPHQGPEALGLGPLEPPRHPSCHPARWLASLWRFCDVAVRLYTCVVPHIFLQLGLLLCLSTVARLSWSGILELILDCCFRPKYMDLPILSCAHTVFFYVAGDLSAFVLKVRLI